MGSFSSGYPSRPARIWLVFVVLAAWAAVAFAGCSDDEEAPAPSDEVEAESPAGDEERVSPEDPERGGEESGAAERAGESGEPGAAALSPEQVEEIRSQIEQRAEQSRERIDEIQRIIEEARAARDPGTLRELAERLRAGRDEWPESAQDFCRRSGAPERICERLGERGAQREDSD